MAFDRGHPLSSQVSGSRQPTRTNAQYLVEMTFIRYRKAKSDELVLLGEVDEYEPLSRSAYYKLMLREKVRNINVKDAEDISKKKEA